MSRTGFDLGRAARKPAASFPQRAAYRAFASQRHQPLHRSPRHHPRRHNPGQRRHPAVQHKDQERYKEPESDALQPEGLHEASFSSSMRDPGSHCAESRLIVDIHARVRGVPLRSRTIGPWIPVYSGRKVTSVVHTCISGILEKKLKRARLALKRQQRAAMIGRSGSMQPGTPTAWSLAPGQCGESE